MKNRRIWDSEWLFKAGVIYFYMLDKRGKWSDNNEYRFEVGGYDEE